MKCPKCNSYLRPHVLWFDEYYNEKHFKEYSVLRISKATGLLFVIGTSGATNLPQVITQNVLSKNGMVVEVNIDRTNFTDLLENKKNGVIVKQYSSEFLTSLSDEIKNILKKSNTVKCCFFVIYLLSMPCRRMSFIPSIWSVNSIICDSICAISF